MRGVELDFAVIGAQKSASTFVHHFLMRHPQIDIPSEESRNFEDPSYAADGLRGIGDLFGPRRPDVRRGLKRPDHLADVVVPGRLHAANPTLGLVVVLREPVARAVSAYFHYQRLGFLPMLALDTGMARVLDGSLAREWPRALDVVDYGRYGRHLQRYLSVFARDRLHVLWQDDLRHDAAPVLAGLLEFLEVRSDLAGELVAKTPRANETSYWPARLRVQRSRNTLLFDYDSDRYRRRPRRPSPAGLAYAAVTTGLDRTVLARLDRRPAPRLDPVLEDQLRARYVADTDLLGRLVGPVPWA